MQVPIWHQRASNLPEGLVIWDYHVILLVRRASDDEVTCDVYDQDTALACNSHPFLVLGRPAVLASTYINLALPDTKELGLPKQFERYYRVIPAASYLDNFASDRSHMLVEGAPNELEGGKVDTGIFRECGIGSGSVRYRSPPPAYPPIVSPATGATNSLPQYIEMESDVAAITHSKTIERCGLSGVQDILNGICAVENRFGFVLSHQQFTEFCSCTVPQM